MVKSLGMERAFGFPETSLWTSRPSRWFFDLCRRHNTVGWPVRASRLWTCVGKTSIQLGDD